MENRDRFLLILGRGTLTAAGASDSGGNTGSLCSYQLMRKGEKRKGGKKEEGEEGGREGRRKERGQYPKL